MEKLITEMTDAIKWKLKDIEKYTKMIDLVTKQDVKGVRKFIYEQETCEKEMFYEYLQWGDKDLFHLVYPEAHKQKGKYVVEIISNQFTNDVKELGLDNVVLEDEGSYPENYTSIDEDCCG